MQQPIQRKITNSNQNGRFVDLIFKMRCSCILFENGRKFWIFFFWIRPHKSTYSKNIQQPILTNVFLPLKRNLKMRHACGNRDKQTQQFSGITFCFLFCFCGFFVVVFSFFLTVTIRFINITTFFFLLSSIGIKSLFLFF